MKYNTKFMNEFRLRKIFLLSFIFVSCVAVNVSAQTMTSAQKKTFKKEFKRGALLMDNGTLNPDNERLADTTRAYFLRCYALDSSNANVAYLLGKLFMSTAMHKAASLPYLMKAVTNIKKKYSPDDASERHAPPLAYYWLGRSQLVNYQVDNALESFGTFKKMLKNGGGERPKDLAYWMACCQNTKDLMANPVECTVINLGDKVNGTYDDYAPLITADETALYFGSKRPMAEDTSHDREGIWMSAGQNNVWGEPVDVGAPLNAIGGNSATVSLSPDGQMMIDYQSSGVTNGLIYITRLQGKTWETPGLIDSNKAGVIDAKGSKYFTPSACMSPNGKTLYFSSDRPGGTGGLDLYSSDMQTDGSWGSPANLGSGINTKYDEDCPFVSYDGGLLLFSSKGHNTMGGYDVFMSKSDGQGGWADPQNLGYPVNTPDDDKFFVLSADGKRGYYNTVRTGTMGERDIYRVTFKNPLPVACVGIMVGYYKSSDGSPIASNTRVTCTGGTIPVVVPVNSSSGKYLAILKPDVNYNVTIAAGTKTLQSFTIKIPSDSAYCKLGRAFMANAGKIGTPNPAAPPTPVVKSKFNTDPYFVKYFGYNLDEVASGDPDYVTLISNINNGIADGTKIIVSIESSASTVPTTKFASNDKLALSRATALKKEIMKSIKNQANVKFELKSSIGGPPYAKDPNDHAKYEKYQYVKAYIREDK